MIHRLSAFALCCLVHALLLEPRPLQPAARAAIAAPVRSPVPLMKGKAKAAKAVKVLLTGDVKGLGKAGELVDVKPAYAENFLVSKGLGNIASKEVIARVAEEAAAAAAAAAEAKKAAVECKASLAQTFGKNGLFIECQVGPNGKLHGSVTAQDVASLIDQRANVKLDKQNIALPSISELGTYSADLKLHPEVSMKVDLVVKKNPITIS